MPKRRTDSELDEPTIRTPPQGMRIGPLVPALDLIRREGLLVEQVCALADIAVSLFDDPDAIISYESAGLFLQKAARLTGLPCFGLLVGAAGTPSSMGLVGFLIQHAPTLGAAVHDLALYLHHQGRRGVPILDRAREVIALGYTVMDVSAPGMGQLIELALALWDRTLRKLLGDDWRAGEVLLSRSRPDDVAPYRRVFDAPLRFDSEVNALLLPTSLMDRRIKGADPALYRYLKRQIETAEAMNSRPFVEDVSRAIRLSLRQGAPTADDVARALGLNKRTLTRRLAAEDSTFSELLSGIRFDMAKRLLLSSTMPLSEIALLLGYSEASAFTRAFRDWSGESPQQWRSVHRALDLRDLLLDSAR
ncbi:hypothetical protein SLNSH_10050 [Alsobacter soli]|uniref:HTH araC/xylS-type domain-containing protein n=1 Tax=Alsobacter soli TaxID=2109933 RepID=A0A2T1HU27_9HYPH|nr:AraC family transcriptional regulator [Alsobacter soli]PSC05151.1 hypothetical protein SLNSH_10050 [Alsobacter soli]